MKDQSVSLQDRARLPFETGQGHIVIEQLLGLRGDRVSPVADGLEIIEIDCTLELPFVKGALIFQIAFGGLTGLLVSQILIVGAIQVADGTGQFVNGLVNLLIHVRLVASDRQFRTPHLGASLSQPQRN